MRVALRVLNADNAADLLERFAPDTIAYDLSRLLAAAKTRDWDAEAFLIALLAVICGRDHQQKFSPRNGQPHHADWFIAGERSQIHWSSVCHSSRHLKNCRERIVECSGS